jgi:hypothetical protein
MNFINFNSFVILIIDVKILSNFKRNGAHLIKKESLKKKFVHSKDLNILKMQKNFDLHQILII